MAHSLYEKAIRSWEIILFHSGTVVKTTVMNNK